MTGDIDRACARGVSVGERRYAFTVEVEGSIPSASMMETLECPSCGNSNFEDFTVTSHGEQVTRDTALAFAVRQEEESMVVSVDCQVCDFSTSRTIVKR